LDSLLATQLELKVEYDQSQQYMRDSTERLAKVLRDMDEEADIITYGSERITPPHHHAIPLISNSSVS